MNLASPALVRYLIRTDLPVSDSCECFTSGVAAYLAATSWLQYVESRATGPRPQCEILDLAPPPSMYAKDLSQRFVGAMVTKDTVFGITFSLAVVLAGSFRRMFPEEDPDAWLTGDWAAELGWCAASEADDAGAAWEDDHPAHGLHYPRIEASGEEFFTNDDDT